MKAVNKLIDEIKEHSNAIEVASSIYLKRDREKKIKSLKRDLKEYCSYKGYNYKQILKRGGIS